MRRRSRSRAAVAAVLIAVVALLALAPEGAAAAHKKKHHGKAGHGAHAHAPAPARAAPAAAAKGDAVEEVEAVEDVEAVEPDAANGADHAAKDGGAAAAGEAGGKASLTLLATLGHLHAAVVHLPIAWVLLLALVDGAALLAGRTELLAAGLYLVVLASASFLPAVVSGLLRFGQLPQDPETAAPALLHRNIMYAGLAIALCLSGLRIARRNVLAGRERWAYLGGVAVLVALVAFGAHLGGKLVYGDDFLPF